MEEESVSTIRETSRNLLQLNRRFNREAESDIRRPVGYKSVTPESIEEIANRLKSKSSITVTDLHILKNGLMEGSRNAEVVLNVYGALRGLVRELTGREVKKQCAAAGCFCNLGLADSKAGTAVVKAAGPYLVAALDSLSSELAVTCTWAVGNLASSGLKASSLLVAQGALTKLCASLLSTDEELREAAVYALVHFCYQMKDELSTDHLHKILTALSKLDINKTLAELLFVISCHDDFTTQILDEYVEKIVRDLQISVQNHLKCCTNNCLVDCKLLQLIRVAANIEINDHYYEILVYNFKQQIEGFNLLLGKDDSIGHSLLWLLGNMYNYRKDCLQVLVEHGLIPSVRKS